MGLAAADAFFILIPTAWQGPFADYDSFDATTALANITEAQPLSRALHIQRFMPATLIPASLTFIRLLFLPLVACGVCMANLRRQRGQARLLWLGHSVFLFASVALTVFWQMRVGVFMELFTLPPLTRLLVVWWDDLRWGLRDRALFCAEIGVFLLLGFLPVVFLPALITPTPIYPDILLFPAARAAPSCPLEPVTAFLNDPRGLGTKPLTILNTGDTAPQLLFATHHAVLAGNFDVPGNADAFAFFHTTDDAQARRIAEKWQADLVLLCRRAPSMYMGKDYYSLAHMRLQKGADGLLRLVNTDASQPLMARLIRGDTPGWLKPIEIPASSDYLMFRIMHRTNTQ